MEETSRKELKPFVIFDDHCSMCKILADYAQARCDFEFMPWSQASLDLNLSAFSRANLLVMISENEIKADDEAWQWLLHHHPSLSSLNWAAEKLHLNRSVAKGASNLGRILRNFCFKCKYARI